MSSSDVKNCMTLYKGDMASHVGRCAELYETTFVMFFSSSKVVAEDLIKLRRYVEGFDWVSKRILETFCSLVYPECWTMQPQEWDDHALTWLAVTMDNMPLCLYFTKIVLRLLCLKSSMTDDQWKAIKTSLVKYVDRLSYDECEKVKVVDVLASFGCLERDACLRVLHQLLGGSHLPDRIAGH